MIEVLDWIWINSNHGSDISVVGTVKQNTSRVMFWKISSHDAPRSLSKFRLLFPMVCPLESLLSFLSFSGILWNSFSEVIAIPSGFAILIVKCSFDLFWSIELLLYTVSIEHCETINNNKVWITVFNVFMCLGKTRAVIHTLPELSESKIAMEYNINTRTHWSVVIWVFIP